MTATFARLVTIQDLSCFGKSSLTVALPVISAAGVEAVPLPTALLSTHTTGFTDYTFLPLSQQMAQIAAHWQKTGVAFDAIHTGYLAQEAQIQTVSAFIDAFSRPGAPVIVDPVMGDAGSLYDGFAADYPEKLRVLCEKADILTPNVTEACLLCGVPYQGESNDAGYLDPLLPALGNLARGGCAVITGVHGPNHTIGALGIQNGKRFALWRAQLPAPVCGTGDLFAAALCALLVRGAPFQQAVADSELFVEKCIRQTIPILKAHPYGLRFEPCLSWLAKQAQQYG